MVRVAASRLVAIGCAALSTGAIAESRLDPMAKAYFFRNRGFGSFALIRGAETSEAATNVREYLYPSSGSGCYIVPEQDAYYFALNTRNSTSPGIYWASFGTTIYHNGAPANFVGLYRNGGWLGAGGRPLQQYEADSNRVDITPQKFLEYHRIGDPDRRARARAEFQRIAGQFHGRWVASSIDSWDYFPSLTGQIRSNFPRVSAMAVSLFRYQTTGRDTPERLTTIRVLRLRSTSFSLLLETPGIGGETTRVLRRFATRADACR